MRLRSLESRIVVLFLLLILGVQLAGFVAVRIGVNDNASAAIRNELIIGEKVFRRLLDQNAQNLITGARVLALDYGFRQAIGTNDSETIASVLVNHGARIGAALTLLVGTDHKIISASAADPGMRRQVSIMQLVDSAEKNGSANGIRLFDQRPYQIVVVPVKAPLTIGWVAMAFSIDQTLINDMRALSALQVSILSRGKSGPWHTEATTLAPLDATILAQQLPGLPGAAMMLPTMVIGGSDFSSRALPLAADGEQSAVVVLQRSLSEAVAPYRQLQLTMLLLTAGCTLLAVVFAD
jgi:hypothetical protein